MRSFTHDSAIRLQLFDRSDKNERISSNIYDTVARLYMVETKISYIHMLLAFPSPSLSLMKLDNSSVEEKIPLRRPTTW